MKRPGHKNFDAVSHKRTWTGVVMAIAVADLVGST